MAQLVITSLFCGTLVALTLIDLDTFRIPDAVTYPGIVVCMVLSVFMGHAHLWDGLVGGVAGYLLIRLIADGYQLVTGRMGMGYGDAKLLAMIGGLLGWQVILPALVLSSFQGSLIGITALVILRKRQGRAGQQHVIQEESNEGDQPLRHARIPFGPFLSLAAIELMLIKDWLPVLFPFSS
jgi:leader peptidase (prepilin peptidase)/N-methyltransferase